jgi:hypothetical protein
MFASLAYKNAVCFSFDSSGSLHELVSDEQPLSTWAAIYGTDAVVIALFAISFMMASRNMNIEKHSEGLTFSDVQHLPLTYIAWFVVCLYSYYGH